jgi:excisionase family DNA binding protein
MFDNGFRAERLWGIDKLVEALGVKKSWVYDQTFRNKIPYRKIGGKLRFDPVEIDAWIEAQPGWSLKISGDFVPQKERNEND